ncbi:MAG: methyltransferase domain-containing protein, partial [Desulfobacteraceae bacterium]|nr:methyltransferase domain-containing protein [Desulfobacteraceae bacterium]
MKKEVEVFGVTYDRYVLFQHHQILTRELGVKKVVDMPSHGAKAAGSLYSIGFGAAGCDVTLVNPEMEMMYGWENLKLQDKVSTITDVDVYKTGIADNKFDLAFNFVTWTELNDPLKYLVEMKRISKKYVLLVTCNNFQPGYPWHRLLHKIFGFEWNHGQVEYNHITRVKKLFKQAGLNVFEYGAIDT